MREHALEQWLNPERRIDVENIKQIQIHFNLYIIRDF